MSTLAVIQARMGSTRLPGKVMERIGTQTMLAQVVSRARRVKHLDAVVVATTVNPADETIVQACKELDVPVYRGSEQDVLDRYYRVAQVHGAKAVVRITSDCPLIDPDIVDKVVQTFLEHKVDYASNFLRRTYPRGLDTEAMTVEALTRAWKEATLPYQRALVSPYLYERGNPFSHISVTQDGDDSRYRWTVDTPEDLAFVRAVYDAFGNKDTFSWKDVLKLLEARPELCKLNQHVRQKTLAEG